MYRWNERAARYIDSKGRFVSTKTVIAQVEAISAREISDIASLSSRLKSGAISLEEWRVGMQQIIKDTHIQNAALARGGIAQMNQSDWGWVGQRIRTQYQYLDNFAKQITKGLPLDGRFMRRAEMYGAAGRETYEEMKRRYMRIYKNAIEARRILSPAADHCVTANRPGCVELAAMGWQAISDITPIGLAQCLTFCKCHYEFRVDDGTVFK